MVIPILLLIIFLRVDADPSGPRVRNALPDTIDVEELLGGEIVDPNEDHTYLHEWMETLREQPIDLNTADAETLADVPFLSATDARNIVRHRRDDGPFISVDSLSRVKDIDADTIRRIRPFVTVLDATVERYGAPSRTSGQGVATVTDRSRDPPALRADIMQRWSRRIELADGFRRDSSGYAGGPSVLQTRIRLGFGRLSGALTLNKDAGEPLLWQPELNQFVFDFIAGHVTIEESGWLRRVVIGDFSLRFALGNILRPPGGIGPAASVPSTSGAAVRPFASSSESGHFRGLAVELEPIRQIRLTAFGSRRRYDARVDTTLDPETPRLLRRSTGLHRTETERHGRAAFIEEVAGSGIHIKMGPLHLGGIAYVLQERLDLSLSPRGSAIRRQTMIASASAAASIRTLHLFGEFTLPQIYSFGAELRAGRFGRVRTRLRRAAATSYYPHAERSSGSTGLVEPVTAAATHMQIHPHDRIRLQLQTETTLRPARTSRHPFPSSRGSAAFDLRIALRSWLTATLYGSRRIVEDPALCNPSTHQKDQTRCLAASQRESIRLQLEYVHSPAIESRLRLERVWAATSAADDFDGLLIYQEVRYQAGQSLSIVGRLANFAVDGHAARIYAYERDLLYAFSTPSFAGVGRRCFIYVRFLPSTTLSFEIKWSETKWEHIESIGSGRERIPGNRVRELRIQLRLRAFR